MGKSTDKLPQYYRTVLGKLAQVGYVSLLPPRPLMPGAVEDTVGLEAAASATPNAPLDLGPARIVAIGRRAGGAVVIHLPEHGDYRGTLLGDVFFAGRQVTAAGQLLFARDFCIFCFENCTAQELKALVGTILTLTPDMTSLLPKTRGRH